jgi:small-conductance mechanosensitive channel
VLTPAVWMDLAVLALCLGMAYALVRLWAGARLKQPSLWFGRRVIDGVLFPALALVLVFVAKKIIANYYPTAAVMTFAVPVLLSLSVIRLFAHALTGVFPQSSWARLGERGISWLAWLAAALWIVGWLPAVLNELDAIALPFGKTRVSLLMLGEGLFTTTVVLIGALWVAATIERRLLSPALSDLSMRQAAVNAVRALLLLLGLLVALSAVGVDLTTLSVMGGAVGVGLGLGLQKLASNYVSGFVILLERSLRIGDMVRVDDFEGRITDIKTRYTLIRALNGREAIVPNEKLITERMENLSLADPNIAQKTQIQVGYDSDVAQVQAILIAAALACGRVLKTPEPAAHLSSFAADGLEFTVVFWIADAHNGLMNVRSDVNVAILSGLRAAGIEIPFPQRVLHHLPGSPTSSTNSSSTSSSMAATS